MLIGAHSFYFGPEMEGSKNKMAKGTKILTALAGVLGGVLGIMRIVTTLSGGESFDLDCDWYCDNCGERLNSQPGFRAGGSWECSSCGYENDVSENNILSTRLVDDGLGGVIEMTEFPSYDSEDPEDY